MGRNAKNLQRDISTIRGKYARSQDPEALARSIEEQLDAIVDAIQELAAETINSPLPPGTMNTGRY